MADPASGGISDGLAQAAGASLSAIGGVVGQFVGAHQTRQQNQENFNNQVKLWNMTNEYNTPLNQRKRYEAAGFNPSLMNGGTVNTASTPSLPSQIPMPKPDVSGMVNGAIATYYDLQKARNDNSIAQAQLAQIAQNIAESRSRQNLNEKDRIDLMTSQKEKNYADINYQNNKIPLVSEQLQGQRISNNMANFAYQQAQKLSDVSIQTAMAQLQNTQQDVRRKLIENANLPQRLQNELLQSAANIDMLRQSVSGKELENALNAEKLKLRKKGIEVSDDILDRVLMGQEGAGAIMGKRALSKGVTLGAHALKSL